MDRLKMHSQDAVSSKIQAIGELFPECITETVDSNGHTQQVVDFDRLRTCLSDGMVEGKDERYLFTWPNKSDAIRLADARTSMTLRPCRAESVAFDTTRNLYIEGDNLEVLKVLRNTYRARVKMIYIDPPYNTGSDFVYEDDFKQAQSDYVRASSQIDEQGNRLVKNLDSNGRFHTDWLNMIYPRIKLAREFLRDDGVIFISIDDHEVENLKKVCSELFGDKNFVAQFVWERAYSPKNDAKYVSVSHDYVLMYAKNIDKFTIGRPPRTAKTNSQYKNPDNDPRGIWMSDNLSVKSYNPLTDFAITTPSGRVVNPPSGGCWRVNKETFDAMVADKRIWFGRNGDGVPRIKRFLSELKKDGITPTSLLFHEEVGHSQEASQDLNALMGMSVFDGPKPLKLLMHLMTLANLSDASSDSMVLDFFGGSSSTAHALMLYNQIHGTNHSFVLVQIPEEVAPKTTAFKAGYSTICQIGKERIRRAGAMLASAPKSDANSTEHIQSASSADAVTESTPAAESVTPAIHAQSASSAMDVGFRVLKLDSSNMTDAFYLPQEMSLAVLVEDNIKSDRSAEDLLFQTMLETDVLLSAPIKLTELNGKEVFEVQNGYLIACFAQSIDLETIKAIALKKPAYFITRDASLQSDDVADNLEQVFSAFSSHTTIKVL